MPRTITIGRARIRRWLDNFAGRHGEPSAAIEVDRVIVSAPDGAGATITVPFPPMRQDRPILDALVEHVALDRRIGALLVRKGGWAVGIFDGAALITSKTGSGYVQGKTKAGGWSQQRYARRRDQQARQLYAKAADTAAAILLPAVDDLDAIATGGDRAAIAAVVDDDRLAPLRPKLPPKVLPCEDPRLRVLQAFGEQFLAVEIELNDLA